MSVNINFYENVKKSIEDIPCQLGSFLFSRNESDTYSLFFCYDGNSWKEIGSGYGFQTVDNISSCAPSKYKVVYSKSDKSIYVSNGTKFKKVVTADDITDFATKEYVDDATKEQSSGSTILHKDNLKKHVIQVSDLSKFYGDVVFNTTDKHLYLYSGSEYKKVVNNTDIVNIVIGSDSTQYLKLESNTLDTKMGTVTSTSYGTVIGTNGLASTSQVVDLTTVTDIDKATIDSWFNNWEDRL